MKSIIFTLLTIFALPAISQNQSPTLVWNKTYGGSQAELVGVFVTTSLFFGRWAAVDSDENDQIYIGTTSSSSDFDVSANFGDEDVWVISLNHLGDTLWTKVLGGNSSERVLKVRAKAGGGCYVVGHSRSDNGSFTDNSTANGYADGFVASFNANGSMNWLRMYGGSSDDFLHDIIETSDGNLVACGESISNDGDLAGAGAGFNWIIKINSENGDIVWSKTYPGPDAPSNDRLENVFRLAELSDNNIILTGYTTPDFNDFNLDRVHIMKLNQDGGLIWTKKIGAVGGGDYPCAILAAENGSFWVLARLVANLGGSGDAANYYGGGGDFWLVKLNSDGDITFEKNYGGSNLDIPYDMLYAADGSLYLAGMSRSNDLDVDLEGFGLVDYWMLKVNPEDGSKLYTMRFGGSSNDFCSGIALTQDGNSIFMVGGTDSDDGIIGNFKGVRDLWVLRLMYDGNLTIENNAIPYLVIYPNPTREFIYLSSPNQDLFDIELLDINGRRIFHKFQTDHMDVSTISRGIYLLQVLSNSGAKEIRKIVLD